MLRLRLMGRGNAGLLLVDARCRWLMRRLLVTHWAMRVETRNHGKPTALPAAALSSGVQPACSGCACLSRCARRLLVPRRAGPCGRVPCTAKAGHPQTPR